MRFWRAPSNDLAFYSRRWRRRHLRVARNQTTSKAYAATHDTHAVRAKKAAATSMPTANANRCGRLIGQVWPLAA